MELLLTIVLLVAPDVQSGALDIARRVQERYEQSDSMRCDFVQLYRSAATRKVTRDSGKLAVKKPGKMRWDYLDPERKLYISDGETVYWYLPEDRQVTRMRLADADQQQTQILFLMGEGNLLRDFEISDASEPNRSDFEEFILVDYRSDLPDYEGSFFLRMVPKREEEFDYLILVVNPKDYDVERMVVFDAFGNTTDYLFLRIERPQLADNIFNFTVPRGVEVFEGQ